MATDDQTEQKPRKRSFLGGFLAFIAVVFFLLVLIAAGGAAYGYHKLNAAGPVTETGDDRIVLIERGSSVLRMANALTEAGAVENPLHLRIAARALDVETQLKAGEFKIPSGASLKEILDVLIKGDSILHPITVPEGLTSAMILRRLQEEGVLQGELPETPLAEGVLLPDTYMTPRGEDRQALINRMIGAQKQVIDELWQTRQPDLPINSKEEALVLASIVEKETGVADERPRVAAVFVNRLRRGMRLESDPTIIYGISAGEPLGRGLRRSEIDRKTDYNTYQIDGLPPTPICNPGRAAIAAVLNPPRTKDIFFVADGTGGHAFAETYSQHQRNVARWRQIERSRSN